MLKPGPVMYIFFTVAVLFVAFIVWLFKRYKKEIIQEQEDLEKAPEDYPLVTVNAVVKEMRCGTSMVGMKSPKSTKFFMIMFLTENNENLTYQVSEELYLSLSEGMNGSLATINGNFFDFQVD